MKKTVFGLLSLLFLVRYSCEQRESNPVPIISALPVLTISARML